MLWVCGLHYLGCTPVAVPSSLLACRQPNVRSAFGSTVGARDLPPRVTAVHGGKSQKAFHQWGAEKGA
jgi:hypothetical protein